MHLITYSLVSFGVLFSMCREPHDMHNTTFIIFNIVILINNDVNGSSSSLSTQKHWSNSFTMYIWIQIQIGSALSIFVHYKGLALKGILLRLEKCHVSRRSLLSHTCKWSDRKLVVPRKSTLCYAFTAFIYNMLIVLAFLLLAFFPAGQNLATPTSG